MLDIESKIENNIGTIALIGELDIASVELFKSKFESFRTQIKSLVIDFSKLNFLDSTGVGSLIQVIRKLKEANMEVNVINISEEVYEVLDLLGIPELLGNEIFEF